MIALTDLRVVTPDGILERGTVLIDGGRIAAVGDAEQIPIPAGAELRSLPGCTLLPGFIDLHIHGGGGADTMDATPEALRTICRTHARHGTTGLLLTTMTQSRERITAALAAARDAWAAGTAFCEDGARVLGIHLEGPYICPTNGRAGAQPVAHIRPYDPDEFAEWLDASGGAMRLLTAAPEQLGNDGIYAAASRAGVVYSMGHTDATADQTQGAIDRGVREATHLFNAMPGIHHRNPGPIPVFLKDARVRVEIIADGYHLAPQVIALAAAAAGSERVILITDAMSGAGMPDGEYELGGLPVTVREGRATLENGTLAGSVLTMERAAANVRDWLGLSWESMARFTSTNAADQMGWTQKGRIEAGADADLVVVDEAMSVRETHIAGRCIFQAS